MGKEHDTSPVSDQRQIIQQIADQWKHIMRELPNRGRGEVMASCSKVLLSDDEPDTLTISIEENWYRALSSDRTIMQNISDVLANKYGVRMQIRFISSPRKVDEPPVRLDLKSERGIILKSTSVIQCELCGGDSFRKENGYFVCERCGCKYSKEEAQKLIKSGTPVASEKQRLEKLYQSAGEAANKKNYDEAQAYYSSILMVKPEEWRAKLEKAYYKVLAGKDEELYDTLSEYINAMFIVFDAINDLDEEDDVELIEAYTLLRLRTYSVCYSVRERLKTSDLEADLRTELYRSCPSILALYADTLSDNDHFDEAISVYSDILDRLDDLDPAFIKAANATVEKIKARKERHIKWWKDYEEKYSR